MPVDVIAQQAGFGKARAHHFARPVGGSVINNEDLVRLADLEAEHSRRLTRATWAVTLAAVGAAASDVELVRAALLAHLDWRKES